MRGNTHVVQSVHDLHAYPTNPPVWSASYVLLAATLHATDKQPVFHGEGAGCPTIYPCVLLSV